MLKPKELKVERLLELLGGIFGWCWSSYYEERTKRLLYYKVTEYPVRRSQVFVVGRRRAYWSGFRSWSRGRHWDRKSRCGVK